MSFYCPQCHAPAVEIEAAIHFPADSRSDEIALQVIVCRQCAFAALAVYEESHRGSLQEDSWEHSAYFMAPADLVQVRQGIESCPDPFNPHCGCQAHRTLGKVDSQGRWQGLSSLATQGSFSIYLV